MAARRAGEDIIDLSHGQPRRAHAPAHRRQAGRGRAARGHARLLGLQGHPAPAPGHLQLVQERATTSSSTPTPRPSSPSAPRRASPTSCSPRSIGRHRAGAQPELPHPHLRRRSSPEPTSARCPWRPGWTSSRSSSAPSGNSSRSRRCSSSASPATRRRSASSWSSSSGWSRSPAARHPGRARPRLRRHRVRRLEGALDHAGARREGRGGRVLHHVQELQHGRLAHRLHGRQPRPGARAGTDQELPRLRHLHARAGGRHRRARGTAGLRRGDPPQVPEAPRRAGEGPARGGLDGGDAQGVDVRLGEDPRGRTRRWARSNSPRSSSRDAKVAVVAGHRLRRLRRRPRPLRADREREPHPAGRARHQGDVAQGRAA